MNFKRYVIQFTTSEGDFFHCVGSPKDPADISNALLMNEKSLKEAVAKNCFTWVGTANGGSEKVSRPHRILEVNCALC